MIGSGHRVTGNRFIHLNLAGCNESANQFGCIYKADEPEMLESGIYLRPGFHCRSRCMETSFAATEISGYGMKSHCIVFGPGVSRNANTLEPTLAPTSARPVTYPDS